MSEKQIHIRLSSGLYRKLKMKCASDSSSIQKHVEDLIAKSTGQRTSQSKPQDIKKNSKQNIVKTLQNCSILNEVDIGELEKLAAKVNIFRFMKGQTIFREEDIADFFRVVASGLVKVYKTSPSGKEFIIDLREEGEVLGEISCLEASSSLVAQAQAIQESELLFISRDDFQAFISRNPRVMFKIARMETIKISNLYTKLVDLLCENADQRVIKVLYESACKYGNILYFTHKEIAEMSATTNETVTRTMAKLKRSGLLELERGKIKIIDTGKLIS